MAKGRILIVEDNVDIAQILKICFVGIGYDVDIAHRGSEAFELTRQRLPHLVILDIMLPDMDGYAVCKALRTTVRTRHIPIIFLTQKDGRSDKISGLELGADDFITKPFDIEELKLRVQNTIRLSLENNQRDPRSGLPSGRLLEEQLRLLMRAKGWAYLDCKINFFNPFKDVYVFVAADEILRFARILISEIIDTIGTPQDFIGHPSSENFIIVTVESVAAKIKQKLKQRFNAEVLAHYSFQDCAQGYLLHKEGGITSKVPFMTLSVGVVTPSQYQFGDIREITELAADARRNDSADA